MSDNQRQFPIQRSTLPVREPTQAAAHTDHPMRHYDRTCPACRESAAPDDKGAVEEYFWWCDNCKSPVEPMHVTFEEHHEDCGHKVRVIKQDLWINHAAAELKRLARENQEMNDRDENIICGLQQRAESAEARLQVSREVVGRCCEVFDCKPSALVMSVKAADAENKELTARNNILAKHIDLRAAGQDPLTVQLRTRAEKAEAEIAALELAAGSVESLNRECTQLNDKICEQIAIIDNLSMMCRRLSYNVKRNGNDKLAHHCVELLKKYDLGGSIIRMAAIAAAGGKDE